ncbi:SCO2521 family protein [Cryptosporangium sp. NPDC051539]|uniref:SCO2521 family protein n=1 Tax=Cryptosporangium sp. NPDC051539 TaxID=3363962 RepID=UPI0037876C78
MSDEAMAIGEIHTALLQHSVALPNETVRRLLAWSSDDPVRVSERPLTRAVSPVVLTGVDCALLTSKKSARGIGTVGSSVAIVDGRVLQSSSFVRLVRVESSRRLPWSYYLSRPATVDVQGRASDAAVVDGFAAGEPEDDRGLDLGAISTRAMGRVTGSAELDRRPPFRIQRNRFRWTWSGRRDDGRAGSVRFRMTGDFERTVRLAVDGVDLDDVVDLCTDLALHDFLLTTLQRLLNRARETGSPLAGRLRPAVEQLLHLWMPGAHLTPALAPVWAGFERDPGFSRQWDASVNRVRDQIAVATLALLESTASD